MTTTTDLKTELAGVTQERDFLLEHLDDLGRDMNELFARIANLEGKYTELEQMIT